MNKSLVFLLLIAGACNSYSPPEEKVVPAKAKPAWYYYPKANVYFDSANKEYTFSGSDGKEWITQKEIPAAMQAMLDKNILIEQPSQPVWADNAKHKLLYAAILYRSPSDTEAPKKISVPVHPSINLPVPEKKKEKKGLRKFFDKIFGRKKKDSAT